MMNINPVTENFRRVNYLRISVTDRCNLRCNYCMPKDGVFLQPHDKILTFEEIVRLVRIFSSLGVSKVRLTGGEPLLRKGIINLLEQINRIEGIKNICVTTNGVLLPIYVEQLANAGVNRINISLDTLKKERFQTITKNNCFSQIMEGIDKAKKLNFESIKLNMVTMRGVNDDEIIDFVNFATRKGLIPRFIEFMKVTPLWQESFFTPIEEIEAICHREFGLEKIERNNSGPAEYCRFRSGIVGFIKTLQDNCSICSRLRLTSTGELRSCLYQSQGISLRDLLRRGASDLALEEVIKNLIVLKRDVNYTMWERPKGYMCSVGG